MKKKKSFISIIKVRDNDENHMKLCLELVVEQIKSFKDQNKIYPIIQISKCSFDLF